MKQIIFCTDKEITTTEISKLEREGFYLEFFNLDNQKGRTTGVKIWREF